MTRYGLLPPSREAVLWGGSDAEVVIGAARTAQEAGHDSAWVGDSLLARPASSRSPSSPRSPSVRRPPADGPRMLRLAGRLFAGWMPFSPTPGDYAAAHAVVVEEAQRAGRDPGAIETAAYLTITVDDRPGGAAEQLDRYMQGGYYGVPGTAMAGIQACHTGTIDTAAEWVAAYVAAGARHLILRMGTPELDTHREVASALIAALRVTA